MSFIKSNLVTADYPQGVQSFDPSGGKDVLFDVDSNGGIIAKTKNIAGGDVSVVVGQSMRCISRSLVGIPFTGSTTPTQLVTITIPGGTLGPNGAFRLWLATTETNNTNVKTLIVRMSGTAFYQAGIASSTGRQLILHGGNRGATGSQLLGFTGVSNPFGNGAGTLVTSSFDTTVDQTIQIIVQLANAADTFTIEGHQLEVVYGA
jgi:hypothetical protein